MFVAAMLIGLGAGAVLHNLALRIRGAVRRRKDRLLNREATLFDLIIWACGDRLREIPNASAEKLLLTGQLDEDAAKVLYWALAECIARNPDDKRLAGFYTFWHSPAFDGYRLYSDKLTPLDTASYEAYCHGNLPRIHELDRHSFADPVLVVPEEYPAKRHLQPAAAAENVDGEVHDAEHAADDGHDKGDNVCC